MTFLTGIRNRPRGIAVVFRLFLYPFAAGVTMGIAGVLVACRIGEMFG